ncbi:hypothetical protein [Opitutus sp. ER46]|uniref:hypothetical protein n=1 Tax=Opitutus sp. ER46 TaxID=2161864 RepID=UPI000D31FC19|nr:hypothetical protein [Opitutus sp. ER46]PTX94357.1 hypothetical protein DB354_11415 [Opitutus sp. ER46]
MISRHPLIPCVLLLTSVAVASEETATPSAHEMLKARLAEEARKPATPARTSATVPPPAPATAQAAPAPVPATPAAAPTPTTATANGNPIVATGPGEIPEPASKSDAKDATLLPKMEVKKERITVLDQQLALQNQQIAREQKLTKPTELDKALNDSRITKPLAIFGGESADVRKNVASERVSLMEDEKDLIEAIAHAKTKAEKAELQRQLDLLRLQRRELEKAMR